MGRNILITIKTMQSSIVGLVEILYFIYNPLQLHPDVPVLVVQTV